MKKKGFIDKISGKVALGVMLLLVTLAVPVWGQNLDWSSQAGGGSGYSVASDGAGNSYVTGYFTGTATFGLGEANETELTSFGNYDIFVAEYANDGTLLWVRQAGGSNYDLGYSIAVDGAGSSYVSGYFIGTATFGPGETNETELTSLGSFDIFVAKYAGDGSLLWARQAGGSNPDLGRGVAVDGAGNSYVTGSFAGIATFGPGENNETVLDSSGTGDIFVAKYADDGNLLWARQAGDGGGYGIAVDGTGNSYVTGSFFGTATFGPGEANETTLVSFGNADIFVARYASDGRLLWVTQAGDSNYDYGFSVAADEAGNSYVTGYFLGTATFGLGEAGETDLTSSGDSDIFVARYASDGSLLWVVQAGGSGEDVGYGIAADEAGNCYVTGNFDSTTTFSPGEASETALTSFGESDIFVAKYAGDGNLRWVRQAGGPSHDNGHGITIDVEGNIYATGFFVGIATFAPGEAEETVLTSFGSSDIFVAKYTENTIQDLIDTIEGFNLNRGIANSLEAKLQSALNALEADNADQHQNAANILEAFINAVKAQRGKELTGEQAEQLIDFATFLSHSLI